MGTLQSPSRLSALLLLLAVCVGLSSEDDSHWSYEGDGPRHWTGSCQNGKLQSPIDLGSSGSTESDFEALSLINYKNTFNGTITNNGHTVQLQVVDHPHSIMFTGGGLNKVYYLEQIHFHWKSEHTIMGNRYPLEVHFVHFEKKLRTIGEAVKSKGGIAVLGVLFHETESQTYDIPVLNEVNNIKFKTKKNIKFSPLSLLPNDITKFYRYYGSLTTPGCDESVVWTVLADTQPLSKKQISLFHKIEDSAGKILQSNYRDLQEQNDRIIYYQSSPPKQVQWVNSASSIQYSLTLMSLSLLIFKYM